VFSQAQTWLNTKNGTSFRIIKKGTSGKKIIPKMIMLVDLLGKGKSSTTNQDTIIYNSLGSDKPFYIPTEQPGLSEIFYQLNEGDSTEIKINADTFYNKVFSSPVPDFIAKGSEVYLYFHIQEALTADEIEQKAQGQHFAEIYDDSVQIEKYCSEQKGFTKLKSGLRYKKLVANTKGKSTAKGNMVSVKYKGWIINGDVFDENIKGAPFSFVLGMKTVINGWEQGLSLMKEGEVCRFVIPWYLAYGSHGNGPIPPFTSIVFDIQLINIK
jgi:FKBP-type peptidyl-prolyl cis-trans isomerase